MTLGTVRLLAPALLLMSLGLTGCGGGASSDRPATVPVQGKVTYEGEPVPEGSITFQPVDQGTEDSVVRPARGDIQSDGTYSLSTFETGDGAIPDKYTVVIESYENQPTAEEYAKGAERVSRIPERYSNAVTTDLTATVPADAQGPVELNFRLTE